MKKMNFTQFADNYCDDSGIDRLSTCFDEDVYYDALDAYDDYLKKFKNGKEASND